MSLNLLATQLELFHAIFDKSCDAVVVVDEKGTVRHWSAAAENMFGFTSSETTGRALNDIVTPPESRDAAIAEFTVFQETGRSPFIGSIFEARLQSKAGAEIWADISLTDISVEQEKWLLAIIRDANSRKERESKLEVAAKTDPLSGLANRSEFQIQLEQNLAKDLSLAFIDVDKLKLINDQYGHPFGDEAILHVAKILTSVFPDVICVARVGGDEFGLITSGLTQMELESQFQVLLQQISSTEFSDEDLKLTISIGVARAGPASTARSLLTAADQAMYQSKKSGGNRVTFVNQGSGFS